MYKEDSCKKNYKIFLSTYLSVLKYIRLGVTCRRETVKPQGGGSGFKISKKRKV